jgi:glycosyltransferase involved in cell wall biosynthesis
LTPRILQIFNRYRQRGGEEVSVDRIYRHLQDECQVERCLFDSRSWDLPGGPGRLRQACWIGHNPQSLEVIQAASKRLHPDYWLVHNLVPVASLGVYGDAWRARIPVIHYCHNFRPFSTSGTLWAGGKICEASLRGNFLPEIWAGAWQGSRLKTAVLAWHLYRLRRSGALQSVQAWIAISEFVAARFRQAGVPPERIYTLLHAWDARQPSSPHQDQGYYLFLGRLVEEKGVKVLVEAWQVLLATLGPECPKLILCGSGPLADFLSRLRDPFIEFRGHCQGEEKRALVDGCRAMLAPTLWWEALGLVTYEAYEAGKPMLAAASGGLTETVRHGFTGLLYPPGDPTALARSVIECERVEPERRAEWGQCGRNWLLQHTSPAGWKRRFRSILEHIEERKRGLA